MSFICLYEGPGNECRNCGGWTKAGGGPFEGDSRFCSEDCYADWDERYRAASQRAAQDWCEDCGYDQGEHAPDCAREKVPAP